MFGINIEYDDEKITYSVREDDGTESGPFAVDSLNEFNEFRMLLNLLGDLAKLFASR